MEPIALLLTLKLSSILCLYIIEQRYHSCRTHEVSVWLIIHMGIHVLLGLDCILHNHSVLYLPQEDVPLKR